MQSHYIPAGNYTSLKYSFQVWTTSLMQVQAQCEKHDWNNRKCRLIILIFKLEITEYPQNIYVGLARE